MERQQHTVPSRARVPQRLERPVNLVASGQEHQHVAIGLRREPLEGLRDQVPHRPFAGGFFQVAHLNRMHPAAGNQQLARGEVLLERARFKRRGHHDDEQVRPQRFLDFQRPRERDVPVQMALVKLVKTDRLHPAQRGVRKHLAKQDPLRHVTDPGGRRAHAVEPDLVADLAPGLAAALAGDTCREHARRETAGLEHHHLAVRQQPAVEQHLGNLGGLAGARGRLEHHARTAGEGGHEGVFQFKNGEV